MIDPENYLNYNRNAWNHLVQSGNRWTRPFDDEVIASARKGLFEVLLTPSKPVPREWFPASGAELLGLASAGGQQCPVFAAAGYRVTSFDNSPEQLNQDKTMAQKHQLEIKTVQGDMSDLSVFDDESFDVVFNPCSTCFVPDVIRVYREVNRILKPGGILMTGITNPVFYLFDMKLAEKGEFVLKYKSPYSDYQSLDKEELNDLIRKNEPLIFGHSLEQHLNGQLQNGLQLTDLFEDHWGENHPVDQYLPCFMATRAVKSK